MPAPVKKPVFDHPLAKALSYNYRVAQPQGWRPGATPTFVSNQDRLAAMRQNASVTDAANQQKLNDWKAQKQAAQDQVNRRYGGRDLQDASTYMVDRSTPDVYEPDGGLISPARSWQEWAPKEVIRNRYDDGNVSDAYLRQVDPDWGWANDPAITEESYRGDKSFFDNLAGMTQKAPLLQAPAQRAPGADHAQLSPMQNRWGGPISAAPSLAQFRGGMPGFGGAAPAPVAPVARPTAPQLQRLASAPAPIQRGNPPVSRVIQPPGGNPPVSRVIQPPGGWPGVGGARPQQQGSMPLAKAPPARPGPLPAPGGGKSAGGQPPQAQNMAPAPQPVQR